MAGSHIEGKADKAVKAMKENERQINRICSFLKDLISTAKKYDTVLMQVNVIYIHKMASFRSFMNLFPETNVNWNELTDKQKSMVESLVLLVGILYEMCKVQLVKQEKNKNGLNQVNHSDINDALSKASTVDSR